MKKLVGMVLLILMVFGMWTFGKAWHANSQLGVGTGRISGEKLDLASRDQRGVGTKLHSNFRGILDNPTRYQNQHVSVTGRVRSPARFAANRNIYTLSDADDRILVIDDGPPPIEYYRRTVNGIVKVVGPPVGGLRYAYIVNVKEGAKFVAPSWNDIKNYFIHSPNG